MLLSCVDVLLLRVGPQAFPRSRVLLGVLLLVYLLGDAVTDWVQGYAALPMLLDTLYDTAFWLAAFTLILGAWKLLPRLEQTLIAWFGAGVLFNFLGFPLALAWRYFTSQDVRAWLALPGFLLALWSMAVMANLLHHALRSPYVLSVVLAATAGTLNILFALYLFPLD